MNSKELATYWIDHPDKAEKLRNFLADGVVKEAFAIIVGMSLPVLDDNRDLMVVANARNFGRLEVERLLNILAFPQKERVELDYEQLEEE